MKQEVLTGGARDDGAESGAGLKRIMIRAASAIVLAAGTAIAALPAQAGTVDWSFSGQFDDAGFASGNFTTDTATGNVLSFSVVTTAGTQDEGSNTAFIPGSAYTTSNSSLTNNFPGFEFTLARNDTTATLVLDFNTFLGSPGTGNIILPGPLFDSQETYFGANTPDPRGLGGTGNGVLAATTPLPAALPLFASGLGGLGLFGWRRKKKAATLAA